MAKKKKARHRHHCWRGRSRSFTVVDHVPCGLVFSGQFSFDHKSLSRTDCRAFRHLKVVHFVGTQERRHEIAVLIIACKVNVLGFTIAIALPLFFFYASFILCRQFMTATVNGGTESSVWFSSIDRNVTAYPGRPSSLHTITSVFKFRDPSILSLSSLHVASSITRKVCSLTLADVAILAHVTAGERRAASCNTPMDLLLDHLSRLFSGGGALPLGSLVVTACDVMLLIPAHVAAAADWSVWSSDYSGDGVAGLAISADARKYAANHGVYCLGEGGVVGLGGSEDEKCSVMDVNRCGFNLPLLCLKIQENGHAFSRSFHFGRNNTKKRFVLN